MVFEPEMVGGCKTLSDFVKGIGLKEDVKHLNVMCLKV